MVTETAITDNKSTFLYRFLVSPELRWAVSYTHLTLPTT